MKEEREQKRKVKKPILYLYLILILFLLLTVATYTWFSITRTPRVSEMGMSVDCGTGMELAFEMESSEWTQYLDFRELSTEMAALKPVTWSEEDKCFYAAEYGIDGRIAGITQRLSDGANTNTKSSNGYYMINTCYARTGEKVKVSLSPAVVHGDGTKGAGTYCIGTPVWNSNSVIHNNGGNGAELAIRIGIKVTKYGREDKLPTGETEFFVYEPNYDRHIDGSTNDVATSSIDGSATLVPGNRLIRQTSSTWTEANPVQRDVVIRKAGEFTTETELFVLNPDEYAKLDFYIWLEGQDVDCTNKIGSDAQIFVNVQFSAEAEVESGLEIIEQ